MTAIWRLSARQAVAALKAGEVTPAELIDALEARADAVDGVVNALPTRCPDRARARAEAARPCAPLHGLPVAIKDLTPVAGVRTTWGSPIYADTRPEASDWLVERLEARGGVVHAKSNTPEFGAGAQTTNPVFGPTRNPWNLALTPAGSSGGAAAALKTGCAYLAHGSDLGGSLRNPASFCGVVGLRPSVGRAPAGPARDPFGTLAVEGPMARDVADLGLFLDALAGEPRAALDAAPPDAPFAAQAARPRAPLRAAFSPDLGLTPVDPEVARICAAAARRFEALGATVEDAHPDLSGAHDAFQTLRALGFAAAHADHLRDHRDKLKPDVVWNIEKGLALTGAEVGAALSARGRIAEAARTFFETHDLLLCPATVLPPFPVETLWPRSCAGVAFATYIDWLAIAYAITLTGCPALSLPCGFTAAGLPVGLQMVAAPRAEGALLSFAAALEDALALDAAPIDPRPAR